MNNESQVLNVPIEDIIPNRFQPRLSFDEAGLQELAASIKEHGIIQPLVLRRLGDKYEIIAGERRYKASKMAGLTSVPAIISVLDDQKSAEVAIVENIQRRDLTSIEEAKSYKALLDKGYLTQEELARKMGLSQSAISNKLRLLSLSEVVQDALMNGKISERHARSLLKIENHEEQEKWLNTIIEERLTVKDLEGRIKALIKIEEPKEEIIEEPKEIQNNSSIQIEEKPIPNKFFNYLESEEANMNVSSEPVLNSFNAEEEIELLDFDVPVTSTVVNEIVDFTNAELVINKLISELKNLNYLVEIETNKDSKELKINLNIKEN